MCYLQRQNPCVHWDLWGQADPATTGQLRVKIDGTVIATSPTFTNTFTVWSADYFWPHGWAFNSAATFAVEAIVTSGTGTVRATTLALRGGQS